MLAHLAGHFEHTHEENTYNRSSQELTAESFLPEYKPAYTPNKDHLLAQRVRAYQLETQQHDAKQCNIQDFLKNQLK